MEKARVMYGMCKASFIYSYNYTVHVYMYMYLGKRS